MSDVVLCTWLHNESDMTSLADVYEEDVGEARIVRRLYLGAGLFLSGAVLTILGMLMATTGLPSLLGVGDEFTAFETAGVLAGLGAPAVFVGVSIILPAELRIRAAAAVGASVAVLGVALFVYAYPEHWLNYGRELTTYVVAVYFLGIMTTLWCVFVGIANFKQRNDPGGTVSLHRITGGETRVVEVEREQDQPTGAGTGGVGILGGTPDGEVKTQTNRSEPSETGTDATSDSRDVQGDSRRATDSSSSRETDRDGSTGTGRRSGGRNDAGGTRSRGAGSPGDSWESSSPSSRGANPASDGGATSSDIRSPLDDVETPESPTSENLADRYCGNCEHFQYVQSSAGMKPYCARHDAVMDDMEACDEWSPNR